MRVHVDPDLCIGCGICEGNAPDVFSLAASAIAEVIMDPVQPDFEEDARSAAEDCPEGAIVIENGEDSETPTPPAADSADDAEEFTNESDLERKFEMKATVDQDLCIGCGICEGVVPRFSASRVNLTLKFCWTPSLKNSRTPSAKPQKNALNPQSRSSNQRLLTK